MPLFYPITDNSFAGHMTSISRASRDPVRIDRQFKINKVPLETVRPFVMQDLLLSKSGIDPNGYKCEDKVTKHCETKVKELIELAG